ncbi:hypothetical protein WMF31_39165 [Sorangium sp. So ce1036]|uniref:hypothetical protein n=1 Tax=Sorangium sp. So ce1036 TaxID=3133328 RepID=UPI003F0E7876
MNTGYPRQTVIVRDREHVLISVDVGEGSALAVPFKPSEPGGSAARLVVRLAARSTPCAGCVDEGLARAVEALGGLDAERVLCAIRAAIARCAERAHGEPPRSAPAAGGPLPGRPPMRLTRALRLAPANAPHVPAAGALPAESDIDVILII